MKGSAPDNDMFNAQESVLKKYPDIKVATIGIEWDYTEITPRQPFMTPQTRPGAIGRYAIRLRKSAVSANLAVARGGARGLAV